ncbi:MAG: hypothetical protein EBY15_02470 [Gammaproteobacteria bacterium]|nr:hypothetical protein [Gammaproteobacteria bacterium]
MGHHLALVDLMTDLALQITLPSKIVIKIAGMQVRFIITHTLHINLLIPFRPQIPSTRMETRRNKLGLSHQIVEALL